MGSGVPCPADGSVTVILPERSVTLPTLLGEKEAGRWGLESRGGGRGGGLEVRRGQR